MLPCCLCPGEVRDRLKWADGKLVKEAVEREVCCAHLFKHHSSICMCLRSELYFYLIIEQSVSVVSECCLSVMLHFSPIQTSCCLLPVVALLHTTRHCVVCML